MMGGRSISKYFMNCGFNLKINVALKGHTTDFFITPLESFLVAEFEIEFFFLILTTFRPPPRPKKVPKNVFLTIMIAKNTFSQGQGGV